MERANKAATLLAGFGLGAALMYFLDPQRGNARRKVARDRAGAALRDARWDLENRRRDLRNRVRGAAAVLATESTDEPVDDVLLVERVRAELGHRLDSIHRLEVAAEGGTITLRGILPARDRLRAISAAAKVRGVQNVVDELTRD